MTTENIELIVSGRDDNATGVLKDVQRESGALGKMLKGGLVVGAAAAVAGIGTLGIVLGDSVGEAMAAEEVTAQLNATLKSTKGIAGMTAKAIDAQSTALSQVTRFEDDAITAGSAILLTYTNVGKDVFPRATDATLDLATAFKMDLASANHMVGKALNDPIKGLTALGRAGVQFTDQQKEVIKTLVETGDMAGAQNLILKELETQVGGSARAAGQTAAGQWDIFRNSIGNVKEEIGGALLPMLKDLGAWAGPKLVEGFQKFSSWIRTGLGDIEELAGKFGKAKGIVGNILDDVKAGEKINWQDLMNLSGLFTNQLDIQRAFGNIVKDIETGIGQLKTAFETGGVGGLFGEAWRMIGDWWKTDAIPWVEELGGNIKAWWDGTLVPWLKANVPTWTEIGTAMQGAWDTIKTFWDTKAVPFATEVAESISTWWMTKVIPVLQTKVPEWADSLNTVLKSVITVGSFKIGNDASLAYTLGAGWTKLLLASFKPLVAGPQLLADALKKAFSGGIGDIDWGAVLGDVFKPIADFLRGALDAFLLSIGEEFAAKISAWWAEIWASIQGAFGNTSSGGSSGAGGGGRSAQIGGRGMIADTRSAAGAPIVVNVYAAGGSPDAVRRMANQGTVEALRARGYW